MNTCSSEHGRVYTSHESKKELGTVSLCYKSPDIDMLTSRISNSISLITCSNHRDDYDFKTSPPLSQEAVEQQIKDIYQLVE